MRDFTFEAAFRRLFIYNILFEDAEVDGKYFGVGQDSRVLGISAAGCGLASLIRFSPQQIDAVDINGHHLALAALRMAATQRLQSFDEFYGLFGRGSVANPQQTVAKLTAHLPFWMQSYWRKHAGRFESSFYDQGLTATMLRVLRRQLGLSSSWMREFVDKDRAERVRVIGELFEPALRRPLVEGVLNSPLQQLVLGVNFSQKSRLLGDEPGDMIDFFLRHCARVAETDCRTNWFAWYAIAGHYNHDEPSAVPPYLRRESHRASIAAGTTTAFHHKSIFDVLAQAGLGTWSHYSLCDAVDWMPRPVQLRLLSEILRTARPGARVLMRSVAGQDVVEGAGLGNRIVRLDEESDAATKEERSRQYRRVDLYEVRP